MLFLSRTNKLSSRHKSRCRCRCIAFKCAITDRHVYIVRIFVDNGVVLNYISSRPRHPLYVATKRGQERTVQLLLDSGADVNLMLGASWLRVPVFVSAAPGIFSMSLPPRHDQVVELALTLENTVDRGNIAPPYQTQPCLISRFQLEVTAHATRAPSPTELAVWFIVEHVRRDLRRSDINR